MALQRYPVFLIARLPWGCQEISRGRHFRATQERWVRARSRYLTMLAWAQYNVRKRTSFENQHLSHRTDKTDVEALNQGGEVPAARVTTYLARVKIFVTEIIFHFATGEKEHVGLAFQGKKIHLELVVFSTLDKTSVFATHKIKKFVIFCDNQPT